jgi:hypothetical protein
MTKQLPLTERCGVMASICYLEDPGFESRLRNRLFVVCLIPSKRMLEQCLKIGNSHPL